MNRITGRVLLLTAVFALLLVLAPAVATGAGPFTDVPDGHTFKADIEWLASTGVTKGCNPPANDRFCPEDPVTRGQMAAFIHRLANGVVDAKTALSAATAADADKLDGKDSTAFAMSGHNHDGEYLGTADYDTDGNGVVDSAAVMIRHASSEQPFDNNMLDNLVCPIGAVEFDTPTVVVATGGLSMVPLGSSNAAIYGHVSYLRSGAADLVGLNGSGHIVDTPEGEASGAAVPITATDVLTPGTYTFGIEPRGGEDIFPAPGAFDYDLSCALVVTAYVGLGDSVDYAFTN